MAKLTAAACRAARGILKWSVRDLAREAGVSPTTVNLLEADRPYRQGTADKIIDALEGQGVEITNGNGTGARLAFVEIRPHQHDDGDWWILVKLTQGAPTILLSPERAALEADSGGTSRAVAAALRSSVDAALRYQGHQMPDALLPALRPTWRISPFSFQFTVARTPPSSEPPRYFPSLEEAECALDQIGRRSAMNPEVWIEDSADWAQPASLDRPARRRSDG